MKENNKIHRIFPCPDYDIAGTQEYLQTMALRGWHLQKDGIFAGIAAFEKGPRRKVRYRLDAAPKKTGFVFGQSAPDDEAKALAAEMGWEFVDYRGEYFIYRCEDDTVPELHTDSEVQAMSIEKVRQREKTNVFNAIFWAVVYPTLVLRGQLLLAVVALTTPVFLWMLVHMIYIVVNRIKQASYLKKVKQALKAGEVIPPLYKDAKTAKRAQFTRTFMNVAFCVWVVVALWGAFDVDEHQLSTYTGDIPFATMEDFVPDSTFEQHKFLLDYYDKIIFDSDILAPNIVEVHQNGDIITDTATYYGGYIITYYDTVHPVIARSLVKEMHRKDKLDCWSFTWDGDENPYREYDLHIEGVDYCLAYRDEIRNTVVIMVKGNKSVHAAYFQASEQQIPLQQWAQVVADSL